MLALGGLLAAVYFLSKREAKEISKGEEKTLKEKGGKIESVSDKYVVIKIPIIGKRRISWDTLKLISGELWRTARIWLLKKKAARGEAMSQEDAELLADYWISKGLWPSDKKARLQLVYNLKTGKARIREEEKGLTIEGALAGIAGVGNVYTGMAIPPRLTVASKNA